MDTHDGDISTHHGYQWYRNSKTYLNIMFSMILNLCYTILYVLLPKHAYACPCTCKHLDVHECTCACMYMYGRVYTRVYMYIHVCTYKSMYIHGYIYIYICVYTCIYMYWTGPLIIGICNRARYTKQILRRKQNK